MTTEEEKRAFGLHKKYGYTPANSKPQKQGTPGRGKLYYGGMFLMENSYPLLQMEKKRLINSGGYTLSKFKITK